MPIKKTADISIIAANYNNGRYLNAFIDSVMQSTMLPLELIIVDDGSKDDSLKILKEHAQLAFLKTIIFKENRGFTIALNTALDVASGKYIMRADPDDLLMLDRIEKQFNHLENNQAIDMLGTNAVYFSDKTGHNINRTNFPINTKAIIKAYHKGEHGLLHATVCGKSHVYKQYRYQNRRPGQDYDLFARMVKDGRHLANLKDVLYKIRIHPASITSQIQKTAIQSTFELRDRIFDTKTSRWKTWTYYQYIKNYRRSQLSTNLLTKYARLFAAILFYPQKLFRRFSR